MNHDSPVARQLDAVPFDGHLHQRRSEELAKLLCVVVSLLIVARVHGEAQRDPVLHVCSSFSGGKLGAIHALWF